MYFDPQKISETFESIIGCRNWCNGKLHDLQSSPDIVRVINAKILKWAGNVARMEQKRNT
jgi:hypothetical protein